MSRTNLPLHTDDISAFARSLCKQLADCDHSPSHVEMLNMLVRSTGHRNFQSFRAQLVARELLDSPRPEPVPVDYVQLRRLTRYFDSNGRLALWPGKFSHREPCLWVLWSKLPPRQVLTEDAINRNLSANHAFRDPALLRRLMCDAGMVSRTADGREYRRVERQPPAEAVALIRYLNTGRPD
jgi:hypothetical protein